jgi:hypothetical protein
VLQGINFGGRLGGRDFLLGHLLDGFADRLVVLRRSPSGQAACLCVDGQAGGGDEAGQHLDDRLRVGVAARVHDQSRLVLVVRRGL